jgi:uncharacterized membrane protein
MAAMMREIADVASWIAVVAMWVIAARAYPALPDRIPKHFDWKGRPDGWGGKGMIWLMPALGVFMYFSVGAAMLPAVARETTPAFLAVMAWLRAEMLVMFWFIESRMIAVARGRARGLGITFLPITLVVILSTSLILTRVAPKASSHRPPPGDMPAQPQ